jgi:hypothetical protein
MKICFLLPTVNVYSILLFVNNVYGGEPMEKRNVADIARRFSSLDEYMAWHRQQHEQRRKERIPRGEGHTKAKITEVQVVEIRRAYYSGAKSSKELAAQYGLSRSALGSLLTGKSWSHVTDGLEAYEAEKAQLRTPEELAAWRQQRKLSQLAKGVKFTAKLTEAEVRAIRAEYVPGKVRMRDLAEKYGVKLATVSDIIARRTWNHI